MAEIARARFELALTNLRPSDWERFEKLASTFLVSDWPQLRTVASASGDEGRDAELFSPDDIPSVLIQYSVTKEWAAKIRKTLARIKETFPQASTLVFLSNQVIGAAADEIKREARQQNIFLDVRDLVWFAERVNSDNGRANAAEELARVVVDPLLQLNKVVKRTGNALTDQEAKTALVFLEMQLSDEQKEKGLTKSAFEALVRGTLNGTNPDARLSRQQLHDGIAKLLPRHAKEMLVPHINAALLRMSRSAIRHWTADDSFCLSHEEGLRLANAAAEIQILNDEFDQDVLEIAESISPLEPEQEDYFLEVVRTVIGKHFLEKGEEFATAIAREQSISPPHAELRDTVLSAVPKQRFSKKITNAELLLRVVSLLFSDSSTATIDYLKLLSDSYTLFAFLEETPDVQKATKKIFAEADIWLDTSVLLPIFAEAAFPQGMRPFTTIFKQARRASIEMFVTQGVIEEVERHFNLCMAYAAPGRWHGRVPYVIQQYLISGKKVSGFAHWLEQFCGKKNPEQDIADYLADEFGIETGRRPDDVPLDADVEAAVKAYWEDVQDRRRNNSQDSFNMATHRLAAHDAENYLIVLKQRKRNSGRSPLGFTSWWLTMDHAAWKMPERLDADVWEKIKYSPLISIDFLLKYLAFGPNRERVNQSDLAHAQVFGSNLVEVPSNLLEVAQQIRIDNASLPERIVQRRIRDALNDARAAAGPVQAAGLDGAAKAISDIF